MSVCTHDEGHACADPPTAQTERRTTTVPEAASELGVSTDLLRDLIRQGEVPVLRLGRRVLVRRTTLERLLAEPEGAQAPIVALLEARSERATKTKASSR